MALNIDANLKDPSNPGSSEPSPTAPSPLVSDVVAELTSWNPREFMAAFRRWHQGSLSLAHLNVLSLLEAEGPVSMSRLAESLDVSVASATGIVDRMETRGLVERRHDSEDRRVVLVHVAPGGSAVFEGIDAHRRMALEHLLSGLSVDELTGLLRGHRALRAAREALRRQHDEALARQHHEALRAAGQADR